MYLKKIELHGFKSFAQKTEVHFHQGITAIVGPNGCGKSNIIDAVRWVLGEQRSRALRSDKMENVIFNGTAKRKPLGLSEVSLIIENNRGVLPVEYTELVISRRLYRSGDSEYLMNDVQCRLKDITDLFMDTGMGSGAYSVIELKMIEEILSENTSERRRLFEEAAGITKYKIRRSQALKKLEGTRQDLARVQDLTDELERQVRSLANQAGKARRYKTYKDRLFTLESFLAQREYDRLSGEIEALKSKQAQLNAEIEAHSTQLTSQEADLEAQRTTLLDLETQLSDQQKIRNAFLEEIRRIEADIRVEKERQATAERNLSRLKFEISEADIRHSNTLEQAAKLEAQIAEHAEKSIAFATELNEAKSAQEEAQRRYDAARQHVEALRTSERNAADQVAKSRQGLVRLQAQMLQLESEQKRLENEQQASQSTLLNLSQRNTDSSSHVDSARNAVEAARNALQSAEVAHTAQSADLNTAQNALRDAERKADALAAEIRLLENLVASYEDFSGAVQFLSKEKSWSEQPPQTVSDLFACDADYQVVVDAALRDFAACFVVASAQEAQNAIQLLRKQGKGQSSFILLDQLSALPSLQNIAEQNIPSLRILDVVRFEANYQPLANALLENAFVTETLDEAQNLAIAHQNSSQLLRFMAKTGEWADTLGMVSGGSQKKGTPTSHRLGRRERLAQIKSDFADWDAKRKTNAEAVAQHQSALKAFNLAELRQKLSQAERAFAETERAAERLNVEQNLINKRQADTEKRLSEILPQFALLRTQLAEAEAQSTSLEAVVKEAEAERIEAEMEFRRLETDRNTTSARFNEANIRRIQAENHLGNLRNDLKRRQGEAEGILRRVKHQESEIESLLSQKAEQASRQSELDAQLLAQYQEKEKVDAGVQTTEAQIMERRVSINQIESATRDLRRRRDEFQREENRCAVHFAEINTRLEALIQSAHENLNLTLGIQETPDFVASESEQTPDAPSEPLSEDEARKEAADLKQKIRGLGAVNELALEAYEEEKARLEFIVAQQADLKKAEEILLATILEINTTATKRFNDTFEEINRHFGYLFTTLFNEGDTAQLLMDNSDPLEAAIQIVAKPRGKKPSTIAQLSGGEKTLTAIALLFAIYLVKPSPFCILDEVDAPLDDANVDRFMRLIRQFSEQTQFILVTHNKLTMEAADRMYGITMQEQGVSKVVSVSFDKVEEEVLGWEKLSNEKI
jgi:chromosome segregation protein